MLHGVELDSYWLTMAHPHTKLLEPSENLIELDSARVLAWKLVLAYVLARLAACLCRAAGDLGLLWPPEGKRQAELSRPTKGPKRTEASVGLESAKGVS